MSVVTGPTQGAQRHAEKVDRWKSRPRLSRFLRALIVIAPLATSIGFTWFAGQVFPPESLGIGKWTWVLLVFTLANILLAALRVGTERLLPLVALMKLTLVFPDHAPSRAKATLRKSSSRTLLREMEEARLRGETTGAALHGDYLVQLLKEVNDHDRLTRGHSERVRAYSELLGEELGLSEEDMYKLRWASLLHDVGKLSVPSEILNKDGRPTDEEWEVMSRHPAVGGTMLEPLRPWLGDWIHAADQHHCRWDGNGYPETLAGNDIAVSGRLVAIADAYDVMTSARSYKSILSPELARQEITECAGAQFDPTMVRAFLQIGLSRLKTVAGPLAWFANLAGSTQVPVPVAGAVTSGAVGAGLSSVGLAVASIGGFVPFVENSPPVLAFEEPAIVVEVEQELLEIDEVVASATEGSPIRIVLTARGGDGELRFSVGSAANGEVQLTGEVSRTDTAFVPDAGDGWENTVTYSPDNEFFGEDTFSFEVCDASGSCETQQVRITVASSNSAPTAREDQASVDAGETIVLDVLANDTDPDVDPLDLRDAGPAGHGQARIVGANLRYTADEDYGGVDEFTYTVVDPEGASATGRVTITVNLPVAPTTTTLAPTTTTTAPTTTTATPTTTTATPTTTTATPTTTTAAPPVNAPPTIGDDATTIAEDLTVLVDVLANDVDPETDPITIASVSTPGSGVATIEAGKIRYTPNPDYSGPDQFTYTASDGVNAAVVGTVNIVVTPTNDSPVITGSGLTVAESIAAGTPVFTVTATDVDPDALTLSITAGDPGGLFAVDPTGLGTLIGTLDFETQPVHTLDITVFDGAVSVTVQVSVTVSDVNEAPTAGDDVSATTEDIPIVVSLGGNDSDPDGDTLNWNLPATTAAGVPLTHVDGDVPYSPPLNFFGADSFTYTVTDPGGLVSNTATASIVVFADNDPPVANNDTGAGFTVLEDGTLTTGNVTTNDTDIDNPIDPTSVLVVDDVLNGTLTNNNNGTFDYTPDLNTNGTDTFTYTITDAGALTSNTATVTLTITPNNDPPVANNDTGAGFTVLEDGTLTTGNVTTNDTDIDNPIDPTSVLVVDDVLNGTLTNNNNGTFDYTPDLNTNGTDTFTYTITDAGALTSNTATVTLTITPNNDAPMVTNPGAQSGTAGGAFSLPIVATDVELDGLSYGAIGLPTGLSIDAAGLISGTLDGATSGTYNVDVTVTDDGVPVRSTTVNFDIDVADYAVSSLAGDLVITEILYAGTASTTGEFLELYNNGATPIDITGFVLADSDLKNDGAQNTNYTIPATDHWGTTSLLQPGEHAVIWASYDGVTLPPVNNPATGLEYVVNNGGGSAFGSFGDSIWLLETPSLIIDYMAYLSGGGDTAPPAALNLWDAGSQGSLGTATGRSLALTPHGVDGDTSDCWEETATGDAAARCPGAPVTIDTASGSRRHSAGGSNNAAVPFGNIVLSEFRPSGPGGATDEFIEIFNADSLSVDLTGWQLGITSGLDLDFYTFPSVAIAPGQHFLVAHTDSPLTGIADGIWTTPNYGSWGDVILKDSGGIPVDVMGYDSGSNPTLFEGAELPNYPGGFLDRSYERLAGGGLGNCVDTDDNSADWFFNTVASTPQNMADPFAPCTPFGVNVVISEFSNVGGETGSNDFIELYNPTAASIDIEGWLLSIANDTAIVQSILLTGPNTVLPPGGHYLLDELGGADQVLVGFGSELAIRIADAGTPIDEVGTVERNNAPALWPALWSEGTGVPPLVAIAGYEQSWERKLGSGVGNCVDTDDNASDFVRNLTAAHVNPQSSADPVELCGSLAAPTTPNHLVISEYRSDGPAGGQDELVEIFNPTGSTISLAGYELRKADDNTTQYTFPAVDLAPGQHYLTGGTAYPGPVDDTHGSFTNASGGLYLYDTNVGSTVDELNTDGSPPNLPLLDGRIDQTYSRRFDGCQDTDVMIDDFFLTGSSTPRTSSDPATPC